MSDDFSLRYRLLKCVAVDEGVRTHNAQEIATGRAVMVHLADAAGPEEVERLRGLLGKLSVVDKNRILETATLPSGFAVVSEFIAGISSFPGWLKQRAVPVAGTDVTLEVESSKEPGAFTLMFGKPDLPANPSDALPSESAGQPTVPAPPARESFAPVSAVPESAIPSAPVAPPGQSSNPEPGEFTRMFAAPSTAAPLPASPTPSPVGANLDFQVAPPPVFGSGVPRVPVVPPVQPSPLFPGSHSVGAVPEPHQPAEPAFSSVPSEATPVHGQGPVILPPPVFSNGGQTPLSPLGGAPNSLGFSGLPGASGGQGGLAASTGPSGPSDFTRMISRASAPVVPTPVVAQKVEQFQTVSKHKRGIPTPLVIIVNFIVVVAIVLIMWVFMRRAPVAPNPSPSTPAGAAIPSRQ